MVRRYLSFRVICSGKRFHLVVDLIRFATMVQNTRDLVNTLANLLFQSLFFRNIQISVSLSRRFVDKHKLIRLLYRLIKSLRVYGSYNVVQIIWKGIRGIFSRNKLTIIVEAVSFLDKQENVDIVMCHVMQQFRNFIID